jgi:hypothetical protein
MNKKISIKVTNNIFGNYRGYVTGKQSYLIGNNSFDAKQWMLSMLNNFPNATVSKTSYFSKEECLMYK